MITIRLSRIGKKNLAFYRVVAIDSKRKTNGQALENLGFWYPSKKDLKIDKERFNFWIKRGAKVSSGLTKIL